jgi:hypothetical protein
MLVVGPFLNRQRAAIEVRNHHMSIKSQLGLNGGTLAIVEQNRPKRTLKTWRILLRSDLQEASVSLSFFAWASRESRFRLPFSMTLSCIAATVLRLRTV